MERIMLSLMFRRETEEAVKSYVSLFSSVFGDSKILRITYYGEEELEALRALPEMTEDIMPGARRECQDHPLPALREGDPCRKRRRIFREIH